MSLCCLTLIFPKSLEETLIDFMLQHPSARLGFTSSKIDGHGHDATLVSMNEKVRGRARKIRLELVFDEAAAEQLIADLQAAYPNISLVYWMAPISRFGRLP